ncbi:MAG: xanthine dehydrogenase family protein molybdopterin-binding subunit, partial [Acidobacteria bacterium]|nr:xanthine dehydrogenase family protein molybdopterin-binding subunit [Acidobacteriota bacterium]
MREVLNPSRRAFLKTSAAATGGLLIGFYLPAGRTLAEAAERETALFAPNAWLRISGDNVVTIILAKSEMGQGVMTSMPMLVAEELEADWSAIRIEQAPIDPAYNNPNMGGMVTAGSTSVRTSWQPLRRAGAAARMMLVTAAARSWGVDEESCYAEKGAVVHRPTGRRLRYGD